jgi:diguanylate cyclase (GGDEF)-like protein
MQKETMYSRTVTFLGAGLFFLFLTAFYLLRADLAPQFFPFYGFLFLWLGFRKERELPFIFLFLISIVAFLTAARVLWPWNRQILLELGALWIFQASLGFYQNGILGKRRDWDIRTNALRAQIVEEERDLEYYQGDREKNLAQIRSSQDLTASAKSLGNTFSSREVHDRLISILSSRFPASQVEIVAVSGDDPLLESAQKRNAPTLLRDAWADRRFHDLLAPYRSGLAIPIKVMRQPAGFLRITSKNPDVFGAEEARAAVLLVAMAAMSLENIKFYEQVQAQAVRDPLTQLYSHKAFQSQLQEELLRSGRSQAPLSLVMADIDHFKSYNDRYGHQAGDSLLKTVSAILNSFARPVDFAARYGGEEFCLILPNFVRSEAVEIANQIRLRVVAQPFFFQGNKSSVTLSLGVASFPQDATSASQIIRAADERLYQAKRGGRNQVAG